MTDKNSTKQMLQEQWDREEEQAILERYRGRDADAEALRAELAAVRAHSEMLKKQLDELSKQKSEMSKQRERQ